MEFDLLPDMIMIKILRFLRMNKKDINSLKQVNTYLNEIINDNYHMVYYDHIEINNKTIDTKIRFGRPILAMDMKCFAEKFTMPKYDIDPAR